MVSVLFRKMVGGNREFDLERGAHTPFSSQNLERGARTPFSSQIKN